MRLTSLVVFSRLAAAFLALALLPTGFSATMYCSSINDDGTITRQDHGQCTLLGVGTYNATITWGPAEGPYTCNIPSSSSTGTGVDFSHPVADGNPATAEAPVLCDLFYQAIGPDTGVEWVDVLTKQPYWIPYELRTVYSAFGVPITVAWPGAEKYTAGTLSCEYRCVDVVTECAYGSCISDWDCPDLCDFTVGCCAYGGGGGGGGGSCYDPNDPLWGACDIGSDTECWDGLCLTGCCERYDPIILDVDGDGYSLTSPENGVFFDMAGHGQKTKVSWTAAGSDDAFLALDRNGNGLIDDASELFSNLSPNATRAGQRTGYNALAFYDKPENGGNGDGWIDKNDAIYSKLLLWVDKNHNGVSEPNELSSLPHLGIARISLNYHQSKWVDAYGNAFRYRAQLVRDGKKGPGRDHWAYDVFLHGVK